MKIKVGDTEANLRVAAVMSTPRLGFMDNFGCWMQSLTPLGITPTRVTGVYWSQCLTRVMEKVIDSNEYILTIDYDTFFTKADVEHLFSLAMAFQCDALTGFQTKRDDGRVMFTLKGTQEAPPESGVTRVPAEWFTHPVQEVDAIHFGCTVISCAALKRTRRPWFVEEPDAEGSWNDGRVDSDMYFWKNFRKSGNSVYVTPRVTLGHGEYKICWPGKDLATPVFQSSSEFLSDEKIPENAWSVKE